MATSLKIFILGCGRSGTNWLGAILGSHRAIDITIEKQPIFGWTTEMALNPAKKPALLPLLIRAYQAEHAAVAPNHYADKSHPNIWHAEELATALPEALFLGIRRDAYATVASMLQHSGVLQWQDRWREFPIPNHFLGITPENQDIYAGMPIAARCALRWRSHSNRLDHLRASLGKRLLVIEYEALVEDTAAQMGEITNFLRLPTPIPVPTVKARPKNLWLDRLSADTKEQIASILEN